MLSDTTHLKTKRSYMESKAGIATDAVSISKRNTLEIDHIIAESVGGTDHIGNLQLLCGHCNKIKGDRGQEYLVAKINER